MADDTAIAVIGMAGRFPGAGDVDRLWHNLLAGDIAIRDITDEELRAAGADPGVASYVRRGAPLAGIDLFDAEFFGFSPREAAMMDPQHRLFLECCWEALELAGYAPRHVEGLTGVFGGCGFPYYAIPQLYDDGRGSIADKLAVATGNDRDSLTSLVSYRLRLRGPSISVQSFCSTSLVAVHLACQSLLTFECDTALAGGASVELPQPTGYHHTEGGILSPDGTVRSLDAAANGTVVANGVGVVVLKRLADALRDRDTVHAVVLGSAVNNDGGVKAGYTAPAVHGQAEVLEAALAVADVPPSSVGYVECHATGTALGDSVELAAMRQVFAGPREEPCVLASLKPQLGHLDRASGVAGFIRACLALREAVLPGTANHRTPNPALEPAGPFRVLATAREWPPGDGPRRAGVSSFGLGGTNAHVVLEEPPVTARAVPSTGPVLMVVSAHDGAALDRAWSALRARLARADAPDPADVAFTLQRSRAWGPVRRAVVCEGAGDVPAGFDAPDRVLSGTAERDRAVQVPRPDGLPDRWWERLCRAVPGVRADDSAPAGVADPGRWLLHAVATCWVGGAEVDWSVLDDGARRRVPLPTYPFHRRRHWIGPERRPNGEAAGDAPRRTRDVRDWFYLPTWRQQPLPRTDTDAPAMGPWLVAGDHPVLDEVARRLRRAGAEVVVALPGTSPGRTAEGAHVVRPDVPEDFARAVRDCGPSGPRTVLHGFAIGSHGVGSHSRFDQAQSSGFHSVAALVAALATRPQPRPVTIGLLTAGAAGVTGTDLRNPQHATAVGLKAVIGQEFPDLSVRHVDLDTAADGSTRAAPAEEVLAEFCGTGAASVAFRGGGRWVRAYESVPLDAPDQPVTTIARHSTVLITGGLGDVGLVVAGHLARTRACNLVLTGRTGLPPRDRWERHLRDDDRQARQIRGVLALEEAGAQVTAVAADVADPEAVERVVAEAGRRFGPVDAVVHGAGVSAPAFFGAVHEMDRAACDAHFRAKVHGFQVLQDVLDGKSRGPRLTLSSLSAMLGGIAFGAYAGANAALDAYAVRARAVEDSPWTTVDWETWRTRQESHPMSGASVAEFAMSPAEGLDAVERVLASAGRLPHVVVSAGPLAARLTTWVDRPAPPPADDGDLLAGLSLLDDQERYPRPDLDTPYRAPATEVERALCDIWSAALGLARVGTEDDFIEVGGHSLVAMRLTELIRRRLGRTASVTLLMRNPTIRSLAEALGGPDARQEDGT